VLKFFSLCYFYNYAKEAAKLRAINAIGDIKKKRLSRMAQLMEVNMRRGCRIALFPVKGELQKYFFEKLFFKNFKTF